MYLRASKIFLQSFDEAILHRTKNIPKELKSKNMFTSNSS